MLHPLRRGRLAGALPLLEQLEPRLLLNGFPAASGFVAVALPPLWNNVDAMVSDGSEVFVGGSQNNGHAAFGVYNTATGSFTDLSSLVPSSYATVLALSAGDGDIAIGAMGPAGTNSNGYFGIYSEQAGTMTDLTAQLQAQTSQNATAVRAVAFDGAHFVLGEQTSVLTTSTTTQFLYTPGSGTFAPLFQNPIDGQFYPYAIAWSGQEYMVTGTTLRPGNNDNIATPIAYAPGGTPTVLTGLPAFGGNDFSFSGPINLAAYDGSNFLVAASNSGQSAAALVDPATNAATDVTSVIPTATRVDTTVGGPGLFYVGGEKSGNGYLAAYTPGQGATDISNLLPGNASDVISGSAAGSAVVLAAGTQGGAVELLVGTNPAPGLPYGHVDVINNTTVEGWAYSADSGANPVQVELNVDGANSFYTANVDRPDLQSALGSADHGFDISLPSLSPGNHTITVSAINPETADVVYLGSSVVTNAAPFGSLDTVNSTTLSGWAYDPNAGSNPIQVRVDINGVQGTPFTASNNRPDLQSALGSSDHGFTVTGNFSNDAIDVYALDNPTNTPVLIFSNAQAPYGHIDTMNVNGITGWAFAPNLGSTSTQVRVDVDGNTGTPFTANITRSDLQGTLGSSNHGFTYSLANLAPGSHTVQVYALNSDSTSATSTLIGSGTVVNSAPFGFVDSATSTTVSGWAYDPDAAGNAVTVNVLVDGTSVGTAVADTYRPDLQSMLGTAYHGFTFNLPTALSGPHVVTVQALDYPSGTPVFIANKTVDDSAPFGSLDQASVGTISGWAYYPSNPSAAVTVNLSIDNTSYGTQSANIARPDLSGALNGSTNHGYSFTTPNLAPGVHHVTVTATDPTTGVVTPLGTATYTNAAPIGFVDTHNSTTVSGWAYDPEAGSTPIQVQLYVNGSLNQTVTAGNSRPDLQPVLGSSNHGFTFSGNFGTGVIDVFALDTPSNQPSLIYSSNAAPIGFVDSVTLTGVSGWAYDPNNGGATPANVRVNVDGFTGIPQPATNPRPDLTAIVGSPNHGFFQPLGSGTSSNTPIGPGVHTIKVYALNPDAAASSANLTLLDSTTINNAAPIGHVDLANGTTVSGWAFDPDAGSTPVNVDVRVDRVPVGVVVANQTRSDLAGVLGSSDHGFSLALPQTLTGPHTITVFAYDNPSNVLVQIGSVQINTAAAFGNLDAANANLISGWAYDPNASGGVGTVELQFDGQNRLSVLANQARPDLQAALGSSDHGFTATTPYLPFGLHSVTAYAVNSATGALTAIGTTTFTVDAPIGFVDSITSTGVSGWAFDADSGANPISVQINVDGTSGTPILANLTRNDLQSTLGSSDHGFSQTLNLSSGTHVISVFAIDPSNGNYVYLGGNTVTV